MLRTPKDRPMSKSVLCERCFAASCTFFALLFFCSFSDRTTNLFEYFFGTKTPCVRCGRNARRRHELFSCFLPRNWLCSYMAVGCGRAVLVWAAGCALGLVSSIIIIIIMDRLLSEPSVIPPPPHAHVYMRRVRTRIRSPCPVVGVYFTYSSWRTFVLCFIHFYCGSWKRQPFKFVR